MAGLVLRLPLILVRSTLRRIIYVVEDTIHLLSGGRKFQRNNLYLAGEWEPQPGAANGKNRDTPRSYKDLLVVGSIPRELYGGAYVRVGPNPYHTPQVKYHVFDGDGAAATFKITKNGSVNMSWTLVNTEKLVIERKLGRYVSSLTPLRQTPPPPTPPSFDSDHLALWLSGVNSTQTVQLGAMKGFSGLLHIILSSLRCKLLPKFSPSTASTSVLAHANKVMAISESDMPYAVRVLCDGALETLGRVMFDGPYDGPFSAHSRVHADGRLFALNYSFEDKLPPATVVCIDENGKFAYSVPIEKTVPNRAYLHDVALTQKYVVIPWMPLLFRPESMVKEGTMPLVFDPTIPARIGLLPVHSRSEDDIVWFELPAFYSFHIANAWEEGDNVVLWLCGMDEVNFDLTQVRDAAKEAVLPNKIVLNTKTGVATREVINTQGFGTGKDPLRWFDFPTVDNARFGTFTRYCYMVVVERPPQHRPAHIGYVAGVMKFDLLNNCEVKKIHFGGKKQSLNVTGGECVFVPRENATSEDDGYLVTLICDFRIGRSAMCIYDAKSMDDEPVATAVAPLRLPSGFHSAFLSEEQMKKEESE